MTSTSGNTDALEGTVLERVARRDRLILLAALCTVTAIAWIWVALGAGTGMSAIGMTGRLETAAIGGIMEPAMWTPGYAGLMFGMWWVMMLAMMLPSASPMLLLFARINRAQKAGERPYLPTGVSRPAI